MNVIYDKKQDLLILELSSKNHPDIFPFETDNFAVEIDLDEERDDDEDLVSIAIRNAKAVIQEILATGILGNETIITKPVASGMVWHEVDSSMIKRFGYDAAEQTLEVIFHKTGVYEYYEVPPEVVDGLIKAESSGRYMQTHIMDTYLYEKK